MLNSALKLNQDYFADDAPRSSVREGFGRALVALAEENEEIVGLCADVTSSLFMTEFKKKFPRRFVQMGVAEQNMAAVASGLSAMGKIPFMASYGIFSPGRNWEQIRTTICYNKRPVKIIGSHGGVSVGPDGGSHQALEDIALTRVLPNMTVLSPCDVLEAEKAVKDSVSIDGPVYIRLSRPEVPVLHTGATSFSVGKAQSVWLPSSGKADVGIIATGTILHEAMLAARWLEERGMWVEVMNLSTIKPIDKEGIIGLAKRTGSIVTVEDHQIAGGMGSAVAEVLAREFPVPQEFVGIADRFGQSGKPDELFKEYGIDSVSIVNAVKKAIGRR